MPLMPSAKPVPTLAAALLLAATATLTLGGCQTTTAGSATTTTVARVAKVPAFPDVTLDQWLATLRIEALGKGVSARTFDAAFAHVRLSDRVTELDTSQPEFTRQVWNYLDGAVSADRVAAGRSRLERHRDLLNKVAAKWGVAPEILVAFWGVETDFGASPGNFPVIDALTTLAYRGRRTDYFRDELLAALQILERGDIALDQMRGSWAGAMGQTQFMPSLYLKNAVDGDGDGKRDIWNNLPDVFASTANDLRADGWRPGESWGQEVQLPQGFPYQDAELNVTKPVSEWARLGVRTMTGATPTGNDPASIITLAGHQGPAFLVRENFRAIMRYNPSTSYALAVGLLADRMAGRSGVIASWPRQEPALSRAERLDLQERLAKLGFDPGKPDGIIGANTRTAVRGFQSAQSLIPDGFATKDLLDKLRAASGG